MQTFNILVLLTVEPDARWREALIPLLPQDRLFWSREAIDPRAVDIVMSESPPRGIWGDFPKLRLIQSLWMGVDKWLDDPTLAPQVPIARMIDPSMVTGMTESVVAHVLHAHLRHDDMRRQQSERIWHEVFNPTASETSVGILGLGSLGTAAAQALLALGFRVHGWSRSPKQLAGVRSYAGEAQLPLFLRECDIVVCLLPLTRETRGLIDARFVAAMRRGAVLINLGRGAQVDETALRQALDAGQLRHAMLDVFQNEPLPPHDPLWRHPRVTVTPHSASMANTYTAARFVADNVERVRRGEAPVGIVGRERGY